MATYIVMYVTSSCASKGLDRKDFAFFHLRLIRVLDERNRFTAMNAVLLDIVPCKITDGFDGERPAPNVYLVAFHGFLDRSTDVAYADVDTSSLAKRISLLILSILEMP